MPRRRSARHRGRRRPPRLKSPLARQLPPGSASPALSAREQANRWPAGRPDDHRNRLRFGGSARRKRFHQRDGRTHVTPPTGRQRRSPAPFQLPWRFRGNALCALSQAVSARVPSGTAGGAAAWFAMAPAATSVTFPRRRLVHRFTNRFSGNVPHMPTLLISTDPAEGLTRPAIDHALQWAHNQTAE